MIILRKKTYDQMIHLLDFQHDKIFSLMRENNNLKRQLNAANNRADSIKGLIFPNTDERGLGDTGTPLNFPDDSNLF